MTLPAGRCCGVAGTRGVVAPLALFPCFTGPWLCVTTKTRHLIRLGQLSRVREFFKSPWLVCRALVSSTMTHCALHNAHSISACTPKNTRRTARGPRAAHPAKFRNPAHCSVVHSSVCSRGRVGLVPRTRQRRFTACASSALSRTHARLVHALLSRRQALLTDMLGFAYETFGHLLRSLRAAATPHGWGRAVGWRQLPKGALRCEHSCENTIHVHVCVTGGCHVPRLGPLSRQHTLVQASRPRLRNSRCPRSLKCIFHLMRNQKKTTTLPRFKPFQSGRLPCLSGGRCTQGTTTALALPAT